MLDNYSQPTQLALQVLDECCSLLTSSSTLPHVRRVHTSSSAIHHLEYFTRVLQQQVKLVLCYLYAC